MAPTTPTATQPSAVLETAAPALTHDFTVTVDGAPKEVHLRRRLPLRIGHQLPKLLAAVDSGDFYDHVALCRLVIESWDLEGDPTAQASYEELDTFGEVPQLIRGVAEHVQARLGVDPKA